MKKTTFLKRTIAVIFITAVILTVCVYAEAESAVVYETKEDFSALEDNASFTEYAPLTNEWRTERATQADCVGEKGTLRFNPFTQLVLDRKLTGPYVFSSDIKSPGAQFFGVFVRSTDENLSGTPYFEHDGTLTDKGEADNEGIGCTGICVIPRGKKLLLCVKTADETKTKGIGTDKTYFDVDCDFSNSFAKLSFDDDGNTLKISAADKPVCSIVMSERTEFDYMSSCKLFSKADIYGADGELVKTVMNCRICAEYSTIAYGMRISTANIDNIYICEYEKQAEEAGPAIEIKRVDIKVQPDKYEYLIGEELDLTDTYLEITYVNNVKEDVKVTEDMVTGFDNGSLGVRLLTVRYGDRAATYSVKIVEEYGMETQTERQTIDIDTSPAVPDDGKGEGVDTKAVIAIAAASVGVVGIALLIFIIRGKKTDEDKL